MKCRQIQTEKAPAPIGPYSQAVEAGSVLYLSGQIAIDPTNGYLTDGGVEDQTRRVLENLKSVLEAGGSDLTHVVKTTIYLKNMDDFTLVNQVYTEYFSESKPARATVEVSRLPKDVLVEMDCIAVKKA